MQEILTEISEQLQKGKAKIVKELVQKAVDEGIPVQTILQDALLAGMDVVGGKFKRNEVFVPEVLITARAMNQGMGVLKPYLKESGIEPLGKAIIGTVKGDLHDIGKNLVKMMLEGKGIEVIDLGTDVSAEDFVEKAKDENAKIICLSALLTTTMGELGNVVEAFEKAGIRDNVTIMVGGAPVTDDFCKKVRADIYQPDAASAAESAKAVLVS